MVSVTMATSEWIQFFKEAGIPPGPAVNYAVMFVDNRIQKSMLLDLNKEIMNELGVTVVGDIIAILKHAKVVHRQDMCKAATESVPCSPSPLPGEIRRGASSAASRMITNSLNRDSPPGTPPRRPDTSTSKISVTVSNKMAAKSAKAAGSFPSWGLCPDVPSSWTFFLHRLFHAWPLFLFQVSAAALARREEESLTGATKRRRVTAEMEGKYIINMPKGTTARTRKILEQQQAAKGLHRTSVFDRLGAETKADTTTGNKPTGVFSRLGATPEMDEDLAWDSDHDSSSSVLQYAGVLKKLGRAPAKASPQPAPTVKAKATSSAATATAPTLRRLAFSSRPGLERKPESLSKVSIIQRLGKAALVPEAQDSQVTSTKSKSSAEVKVTIKRTLVGPRGSSSSEGLGAQMDHAGTVSVFKRLGRRTF
ncbi:uncharacterized protein C19orf47 homolog isoform X1 [Balaenoptera acutorostrata]|uniref:Uncharacterized protein C19orf47 homolog isoform X1 n=1 Tax=Balaenoptera acutorostrata TaxID=9767 RepID=A0A452CQ74_BALAC|nr:uncharacterized protein C19orf47 homolog isoform X1 [Balaenoptera acutorostrata]XP_057389672.1 uncharacterized protein C19orf47 homolog isoform X1 [Balaenoptera acutorostrata]XP_057389673.1 uncharacterized protein C19orf47 homolog isoform X1 [Balaenoptera acutorostrata]XP_057389674.1 uncharacterized protein C19orf47 homolog isoform X1 [Balaenoptera acutorostrata]XP_057389675.1 uncharacterized protein C19orf47 homolog isoform X1 [Balaenoptera acutorostrata]